ncbi:MAG TPA: NAD(P)-dependent oxidoreductase [Rhodospirillaceae bacterium]|nr:NAD(P)-dependent oxidoreductase [Rhodospirillaceae bacterium]|tara:strand:- start:5753 stop:6514 length:762 start_codon:yes stop_codon:yes gene_type:complete
MSVSLDGRVALITGAGSGIGRSHAVLMAERGADLIVNDLNSEGLAETAECAASSGGKVIQFVHDVSDVAGMARKTQAAEVELGKIDILVNNAGVSGERLAFEDVTEYAYDRMVDINLKGSFFLTQAVVPGMKKRRYGKIINTSSMYALGGNNVAAHYSAAKSALSGLTNSLARELAEWNIMVNAVAPGFVLTGMTSRGRDREGLKKRVEQVPLKRMSGEFDMAYTVAFLASDEADFITGQIISPNGGERIVGI